MIYFIQGGEDGPIKIGRARDPSGRLLEMQVGSPVPLRLLAYFDGDRSEERRLHELFRHVRLRGEWFSPSEGLLALIADGDWETARREKLKAAIQNRRDPLAEEKRA